MSVERLVATLPVVEFNAPPIDVAVLPVTAPPTPLIVFHVVLLSPPSVLPTPERSSPAWLTPRPALHKTKDTPRILTLLHTDMDVTPLLIRLNQSSSSQCKGQVFLGDFVYV